MGKLIIVEPWPDRVDSTDVRRGTVAAFDANGTAWQLTLDGSEVEHVNVTRGRRNGQLGKLQRSVLAAATLHDGLITPVQAGVAAHTRRGYCGFGAKHGPENGVACCGYCSTDGLELLHSLIKRQLIERIGRGMYVLVSH